MKAIRLEKQGGPEVLKLLDIAPIPEIGKGPLREAKDPCQFDLFLKPITDSSQTLHCFFADPAF